MNNEYLQLGAVAIIFIIAIKEFFAFLNKRKNGNGETTTTDRKVFEELRTMNNNHLHSIEDAIVNGNKEIVKAISDGNLKMIEILGEIKGGLRK